MSAVRFSTSTNGSRSERRNTASSTTSQGSVTFPSHALRYSVLQQTAQRLSQQQQPSRPPSRETNARAPKLSPVLYVNERLLRFEDLLAQKAPTVTINVAYQEFLRSYEACRIDDDDPSETHEIQKLRQNLRFSRWTMFKLLRSEYTAGCSEGCIIEEDLFDEHEVVGYRDDWCDASFAAANASASSDDDADSIATLSDIIPYYEDATIVQETARFPALQRSTAIRAKDSPRTQPLPVRRVATFPNMPGAHLTRQSKFNIHEPIMERNDWQPEYYSRQSWI